MQCPKCKSPLEITESEVYLDRKSIWVKIACEDNACPFFKVLELSLDDIIGIGKDPETEAESRAAIARAIKRSVTKS